MEPPLPKAGVAKYAREFRNGERRHLRLFSVTLICLFSVLAVWLSSEFVLGFREPRVIYSGNHGNEYFVKADIGYQGKPGKYSVVRSTAGGKILYRANYTIGEDGFRVTPGNNRNGPKINFLGCSLTFGEGLNDDQTLPFYVSRLGKSEVKNFGFHGYGPHQALAILTSSRNTSGETNFFLTAPWHALRSACIPSYSAGSPRYVIENGEVKRSGECELTSHFIFEQILLGSRIYELFRNRFQDQDAQLDLYIALIEKMNQLSIERGQKFLVGFVKADQNWFHGSYSNEAVVNKLEGLGIQVLDLTLAQRNEDLDGKYLIPIDKHPSALANEERAKLILGRLSSRLLNLPPRAEKSETLGRGAKRQRPPLNNEPLESRKNRSQKSQTLRTLPPTSETLLLRG